MNENVPIVGQPFTILRWNPLVLLFCKCQEQSGIMNLLQIFGFGNATACPKCGKLYTATGIKATTEGQAEIVVTLTLPTPSSQVM